MKGVQIVEPNKLQIVDLEKPQIDKENNVLVRMVAAGICGSDVGIYHGTNAAATYPRIIGHENVGIVEEIGEGVTRVKVGDRVIIDQVTACGHCYACRKGRPNVCGSLKVRGVHIDGGYREYMAVPDRDCYLVPEILSDEEAVMIEPTTIAVQCCSRAELESEDTVMIIGSGALGSSILRIVKLYNPKAIIVTDIDDAKLEEAKKNGATYTINSLKEDVPAKAHELTGGLWPHRDHRCRLRQGQPADRSAGHRQRRPRHHHGLLRGSHRGQPVRHYFQGAGRSRQPPAEPQVPGCHRSGQRGQGGSARQHLPHLELRGCTGSLRLRGQPRSFLPQGRSDLQEVRTLHRVVSAL